MRRICKQDTVFLDADKVQDGQPYEFQKDGFKLVVHTGDVKAIVFTCDNCGDVAEQDGLCDDCKKLGRLLEPGRKA